jgi:GTP cyclohydrolase I
MVAERLGVPIVEKPEKGMFCLIIDDLIDSGRTMKRYFDSDHRWMDAGFRKPHSPRHLAPHAREIDAWIAFPWEKNDGAPTDAIVRLIEWCGEDPSREGLLDTPERVMKAWAEMTAGYKKNIGEILSVSFDVAYDEMVILRDIPFVSMCEHHLLPFEGMASVAYIPKERVVGLSKLARLVDAYARRLQVQERMTQEIRQALDEHLDPLGAGVIIRASHTCMRYRGIMKSGQMITSSLSGRLRADDAARAEFLSLVE